ncbi:MAG: phage tail fiber protein [Candidatus Limnocylindrus sp.]
MSFTDYLEEKLLDHTFRSIAYTAPAALYVGVFTGAPGESDLGVEVSGGSYARQAVTFSRSGSVLTNTSAINFPGATADWGTVISGGVFDAASSGNLLAKAALASARTVLSGDILTISAGQLTISLD